jgi:hypothetical protein
LDEIFSNWQAIFIAKLGNDGLEKRASALTSLAPSPLEGALMLARYLISPSR